MILDTRDNLPPKATQTSVYIREHNVPVGRTIVDPISFMNNPNGIIKCAIFLPHLFNHREFCLVDFSLIQISALNFKCWHYVALVTLRVVPVMRAKLCRGL